MNRTIYIWIIVIILWIISDCAVWSANYNNGEAEHGLTYSRESLLLLQNSIHCSLNPDTVIPSEIRASLKRKRGRQGGVRCRLRRRPYRPPLPSIILANVRSLRNKMDLLHAKCLMGSSFRRRVSLLCARHGWTALSQTVRLALMASGSYGPTDLNIRGKLGVGACVCLSTLAGVLTSRYTVRSATRTWSCSPCQPELSISPVSSRLFCLVVCMFHQAPT